MSFRLKEITFRVKCGEPMCPFDTEFIVRENIAGATEADVDSEAWKIAKDMAYIRHDAIYGTKHQLNNPELRKISARYDRLGPVGAPDVPSAAPTAPQASVRRFSKGDKIIRKGESAITVCEVIRGSAYNEKRPELFYQPGTTFGAAALFENKNRMADIVAGQDDTLIGFYNMRELSKTNPAKARELYNAAMEDIFDVLTYLEGYSASLERQLTRARTQKKPVKKAAAKRPAKARKPAGKKAAKKPAKSARKKAAAKR